MVWLLINVSKGLVSSAQFIYHNPIPMPIYLELFFLLYRDAEILREKQRKKEDAAAEAVAKSGKPK